jgi:DNA invertase Pin-like site-specific DNA recombinase
MRVGYVRISTSDGTQTTARQDEIMKQLQVEEVFTDKATGRNTDRPGLQSMLSFVRKGDIVCVESLSRLGRSTKDVLTIIDTFAKRGVGFASQKEAIDTSTPQGRFVLTIFSALSELEVEVTRQRMLEGVAIAKAAGKYTGRQPIKIDWSEFGRLYTQWKSGKITAVAMQKALGLTPRTFYRKAKEYEKRGGC